MGKKLRCCRSEEKKELEGQKDGVREGEGGKRRRAQGTRRAATGSAISFHFSRHHFENENPCKPHLPSVTPIVSGLSK